MQNGFLQGCSDSAAMCKDFLDGTDCSTFHLQMCRHWWPENTPGPRSVVQVPAGAWQAMHSFLSRHQQVHAQLNAALFVT